MSFIAAVWIRNASPEVLERTGMLVKHTDALVLLKEAGFGSGGEAEDQCSCRPGAGTREIIELLPMKGNLGLTVCR